MSIAKLKGSSDTIKANFPAIIAEFDADIERAPKDLAMVGKTGAQALREQPGFSAYYAMRKATAVKLSKYMEAQVEACRGRLWRQYTDIPSRELNDRAKDKYIDNEPEYLAYQELYLEIKEICDKLDAICEAFNRRGFALRDWTTLKINEMQDTLI